MRNGLRCWLMMTNLIERLRGYNPPDRTVDDQRQIAVDIMEAADLLVACRRVISEMLSPLHEPTTRLRALQLAQKLDE